MAVSEQSRGLEAQAARRRNPVARVGAAGARWLTRAVNLVLGVLMFIAVVINVVNAFGRTFFGSPLGWAEEVLSYGLLWVVFLGAAVLALRDEHIRVDLAASFLPRRWSAYLRAVLAVIGGLISGYVALQAWDVVELMLMSGRRSVVVSVPMSIVHGALLIGFSLMAVLGVLRGLTDLVRLVRAGTAE